MDPFVNEKDFALLGQDRYTFEVLSRIIGGECDLIASNHENLLICHSEARYPVWIWTPENAPEKVKEAAWDFVCAFRPLSEGYRFNLKYDTAEYFIAKAAEKGITAGIRTNLFAYDCPLPQPPEIAADGALYPCKPEDVEEAAALLPGLYTEIGDEAPSREV